MVDIQNHRVTYRVSSSSKVRYRLALAKNGRKKLSEKIIEKSSSILDCRQQFEEFLPSLGYAAFLNFRG